MNDEKVEQTIGSLLRAGVILSASIVIVGGVIYLSRHGHELPQHHAFKGEPSSWSTLSGLFSASTLGSGRGLIMLGLLTLILTPVTRVAFSAVAFALERDWMYVAISCTVLALLTYSLFSA